MTDRYIFRGKRVVNGEWVQGYLVGYCEKGELVYYISVNDTSSGIFQWEINPATVGQCTGLRDRNGTLIFEGDIVSRTTNCGEQRRRRMDASRRDVL